MIRPARPDDVGALVALVRELADYERSLAEVELDEDALGAALFGEPPRAAAHVAEVSGAVVGMAIWYRTFSTWTGRHGIWLEDLFVRPAARRQGHATALLGALAAQAVAEGAARLEWSVLDWNEPARRFYAAAGAADLEQWRLNRLSGPALAGAARETTAQERPAGRFP